MLEFDAAAFGTPDSFLKDNQEFELGNFIIKAIHTPGHSRGTTCFQIDNYLFSGDVLFYRTVGRTDVQNSSREDQIKSVKKLYKILPDTTIVYPAHGRKTDIDSERKYNKRISQYGGEWLENK